MGYYNEGHTDGCRTNKYCPGCEKEDRLEVLREVRDALLHLDRRELEMDHTGGWMIKDDKGDWLYLEEIEELFEKGGRFDCEDGR